MNRQARILSAMIFISMMISACSNYPKIISTTEDQVILKAKPESFLDAYDIAKKECDRNTRVAQYITDGTESLSEVAFSCFDPNAEAEVVAEAGVETEENVESAVDDDTNIEETSEEIPAQ